MKTSLAGQRMRWGMSLKQVAGAAAGVVAIGAALALIGLDLPKIATHRTIEAHAQQNDLAFAELSSDVTKVAQLATQSALESSELRAGELRILIQQMLAARAECAQRPNCDESFLDPAPLRAQVRNLERRAEGLESDLLGLRRN